MDASDLIEFFPSLYHVTAVENWETIQQLGLLSTTALLDRFEVDANRRLEFERARRPQSVVLEHPKLGRAVLRDNKPLIESRLAGCLQDGLSPEDWYEILNRRLFFWPTWQRVETLRSAAAYKSSSQLVIEVSTERLVEACADRIELSPMNSGATRPFAYPRGLDTFKSLEEYDFEGWRRKRGPRKAIVEVTVSYALEQLTDVAVAVTQYNPPDANEVIWSRHDS